MASALIESHFLPSLEFFCAIAPFDKVELEHHEHFVKQSYRNHTIISTANGLHKLVVPLASKKNRTLTKDVKVDYTSNWLNTAWRSIESAYRKSPYFEHYADELHQRFFRKQVFLVDLNLDLLMLSLNWLASKKEIFHTQEYNKSSAATDLRNVILSKKPYSLRRIFRPVPYTQVFGKSFAENLSIIDLIFCKGPEASGIIQESRLNL